MLKTNCKVHNRYQLIEKLGQNLGRQTWRALDLNSSSNQVVILKLLAIDHQMHWHNLKLFEREANVLNHLNHPYIPKYRDYFSIEDGNFWVGLVHDYISGVSLRYLIDTGKRFSEAEIENIACGLLDILIYLHELNPIVLHRDIKPSNIILDEDHKIHLVDFGSIQARAAVEGGTFTIVGTYGYTPMEQYGGRADPASDLYALGATLIHLLTGRTPADLPQQNMRIQFRKHVRISTDLINWIEVLTHPNVNLRFSTAQQALEALTSPRRIKQTYCTLQRPENSKIRLKRDNFRLSIMLPQRGIRLRDSLIIIWTIALYAATIPFSIIAFPFIILYWLIGLIPVCFLILSVFSYVELNFNRRYFIFKWKLLWFRYQMVKGYTAIIHTICENTDSSVQQSSEIPTTLEIQAGETIYQFGGIISPLSVLERQWLVYEIKEWLGLT